MDEEEDDGNKCLLRNEGRNSIAGVQRMPLFVLTQRWRNERGREVCQFRRGNICLWCITRRRRRRRRGRGTKARNIASACQDAMRVHVHPRPFTKPLQARDAFALRESVDVSPNCSPLTHRLHNLKYGPVGAASVPSNTLSLQAYLLIGYYYNPPTYMFTVCLMSQEAFTMHMYALLFPLSPTTLFRFLSLLSFDSFAIPMTRHVLQF